MILPTVNESPWRIVQGEGNEEIHFQTICSLHSGNSVLVQLVNVRVGDAIQALVLKQIVSTRDCTHLVGEIQKLKMLQKTKNIIQLRRLANDGDSIFMFLEVGRHSLQYLQGCKCLTLTMLINFLLESINALRQLNQSSLVHCDIKPSNILLCAQGFKICDLGSAKYQMVPGYTLATPIYMPPETNLDQQTLSYQSADIWCLGLSFYELFTGDTDLKAKVQCSVKGGIFSLDRLKQDPSNSPTLNKKLSFLKQVQLDQVIQHMIVFDPSRRQLINPFIILTKVKQNLSKNQNLLWLYNAYLVSLHIEQSPGNLTEKSQLTTPFEQRRSISQLYRQLIEVSQIRSQIVSNNNNIRSQVLGLIRNINTTSNKTSQWYKLIIKISLIMPLIIKESVRRRICNVWQLHLQPLERLVDYQQILSCRLSNEFQLQKVCQH